MGNWARGLVIPLPFIVSKSLHQNRPSALHFMLRILWGSRNGSISLFLRRGLFGSRRQAIRLVPLEELPSEDVMGERKKDAMIGCGSRPLTERG